MQNYVYAMDQFDRISFEFGVLSQNFYSTGKLVYFLWSYLGGIFATDHVISFCLCPVQYKALIGGPRASAGHRKYSGILEKFYQWPLFTVSILGQHFWSALGSAFATSASRHQGEYNSKTSLLKRARVGALSEGNM